MSQRACVLIVLLSLSIGASGMRHKVSRSVDEGASSAGSIDELQKVLVNEVSTDLKDVPKDVKGEKFGEGWFDENCDFSEYHKAPFDAPEYKYDDHVKENDDKKWYELKKCEYIGDDRENKHEGEEIFEIAERHGVGSCADICWKKATEMPGKVVCCEHDSARKKCTWFVDWMALTDSDYGRGVLDWRQPKVARLLYYPPTSKGLTEEQAPLQIDTEIETTSESRGYMKELIKEVNHMSIDGILEHMLSFYICMRWVPDAEFLKLADFELRSVAVNHTTPALGQDARLSREDLIRKYMQYDLIPLRCGTATHVQNYKEIDELSRSFNDANSDITDIYDFSKRVAEAKCGITDSWSSCVEAVDKVMGTKKNDEDSVYVQDMRARARRSLQWSTFLRPSNVHPHHKSAPKNAFLLCFGPRVASFPHKRQNGEHFLADANMAGCNGFWDLNDVKDHLQRIKKLFAPEQCFEYRLRKELKSQFLNTFVSMNEEFERAMAGVYQKRLHELDPEQNYKNLKPTTNYDQVGKIDTSRASKKYKNVAGLLARASSKWIMCPKNQGVGEAAAGIEDNFFRDPKAYNKWLEEDLDDTKPECKTIDDQTQCVRCVVAVKNEHDCPVRLNVNLKSIYNAMRDVGSYHFLQTPYADLKKVVKKNEQGKEMFDHWEVVEKKGMCMVMKNGIRLTLSDDDEVVLLDDTQGVFKNGTYGNEASGFLPSPFAKEKARYHVRKRYTLNDRDVKELSKLGNFTSDADLLQRCVAAQNDPQGQRDEASCEDIMSRGLHRVQGVNDAWDNFAESFIFTHHIKSVQNRPAHKVDYFISCPCQKQDNSPGKYFDEVGSQGMDEYWNR